MASQDESKTFTVALAGQPNVGKSTVFNLLTGMNQHVGNWPGKTIEQKVGHFTHNGTTFRLVDLPGTYSLTANSGEELVARDFIIREQPDVVVALLDAATLERSLYLVAELLPLPSPVIAALNMMDVAQEEGYEIEPQVLQAALGVRVVPMVATKNIGTRELAQAIEEVVSGGDEYAPKRPEIRADHAEVQHEIESLIAGHVPEPYPEDWAALKLLEGDSEITRLVREQLSEERWAALHEVLRAHDDAMVAVASGRYEWIHRMIRAAVTCPKAGLICRTERIDRWAAHPVWGLLLLAGILGMAFWLTFSIGAPVQDWLQTRVVGSLAGLITSSLAGRPAWLRGLLVHGVLGGAGTVITFLPILAIFFAILSLLEDTGYMARAAYVMDRFMHIMGLHGKSFLPLFLGFGCNVPAVMGARVIESRRARLLTIVLAPLIPCAARMTVTAFLAPAFFGQSAVLISWGLVLLNVIVLALLGIFLNRAVFRGERAAFIMELPLYHAPNWRTIGMAVWRHSAAFLSKAGSLIVVISIVVWALSVLPGGDLETSVLARVGRSLEPLGRLMGFDWRLIVAMLTSFVAKENSIATLGVLLGAGQEAGLPELMARQFEPPAGLAFLVVQMLFVPCVASVAVIRQEAGAWRWALLSVGMLLVVSLLAGALAYQVARVF
jgi:ferrous iron transport protein B